MSTKEEVHPTRRMLFPSITQTPRLLNLDGVSRLYLLSLPISSTCTGSLLSMLSGTKQQPAAGSSNGLISSSSSSMSALAAAAGSGVSGREANRHVLSGRDLEHLQQLHHFFHSLVDDMSSNVQRLALRGFNTWLVRNCLCVCHVCVYVCGVEAVHGVCLWCLCWHLDVTAETCCRCYMNTQGAGTVEPACQPPTLAAPVSSSSLPSPRLLVLLGGHACVCA